MSTPAPFDASPLIDTADRRTIREYVARLRSSGRAPQPNIVGAVFAVVIGAVFVIMFSVAFSTVAGGIIAATTRGAVGPLSVLSLLLLVAMAVIGAIGAVRLVRGSSGERWWRLDRFATANGMKWYAVVVAPPLPGMIFDIGRDRKATDVVRDDDPRTVEFGNYQYTTGSGKNQTTHRWGYVAIRLSTPLPNIVLDAEGNNSFFGSNLPAALDRSQRLSLEGDFDRYFTLYCPAGYERDALYLFTPDIMARFVDNAAALDVEIVDDWLLLYAKREVSTIDPATWAWLLSTVTALVDKFGQWERWRDERLAAAASLAPNLAQSPASPGSAPGQAGALPFAGSDALLRPPPGVAPQGRRLRRGIPWTTVIAVGAFVVLWLIAQSGGFGVLFGR